jgi:phosphate:Na+ symporter
VNVIGTGFIMVVYGLANTFFELTFLSVSVAPWSIALIHTIFNVVITILLMPFSKWIIRLAEVLVKDKPADQKKDEQKVSKKKTIRNVHRKKTK